MYIRLTINKPLIIEAVKNETFHKGQIDKTPSASGSPATTPNITLAYHEQAGDETYHERIIERSLSANLSDFKTHLSDYLTENGQTSADNIVERTEGNNIILVLSVSDRFNTSMTDPLAKLASEYITNAILMDWYKPVNEKQSALYATFLERNLTAIHRCFNKTAPAAPVTPYTSVIDVPGSAIDITIGEEYTVTYGLSDGAIDDIECRVENKCVCSIGRSPQGFTVRGHHRGHTFIELYSRHNEELAKAIDVFVHNHGQS